MYVDEWVYMSVCIWGCVDEGVYMRVCLCGCVYEGVCVCVDSDLLALSGSSVSTVFSSGWKRKSST